MLSLRIAGVNIPPNKHINIALTAVYGIGRSVSNKMCDKLGILRQTKAKDLSNEEFEKIREEIAQGEVDETLLIEGNLRRQISQNIKRLKDCGCYRGIRHRRGLPVRGQRTRTNARTCKGPTKQLVGSRKKK
jgi:small subunit ribosomal protein S13